MVLINGLSHDVWSSEPEKITSAHIGSWYCSPGPPASDREDFRSFPPESTAGKWRAGKWTIELGYCPSYKPPFSSRIFQPCLITPEGYIFYVLIIYIVRVWPYLYLWYINMYLIWYDIIWGYRYQRQTPGFPRVFALDSPAAIQRQRMVGRALCSGRRHWGVAMWPRQTLAA